jgi:uncharacterized OsmC-like protein
MLKARYPALRRTFFRGDIRWKTYFLNGSGVGTQTTMTVNGKTTMTDLPRYMGGLDKGMQPVELFLTSLCGCEQATALFIARNMKPRVKIEKIDFEVNGKRDDKGAITLPLDIATDKLPPAMLTRIWGTAIVHTDASQVDIDFIAKEVKRRCPVANMVIASGCQLDISFKKAPVACEEDMEERG